MPNVRLRGFLDGALCQFPAACSSHEDFVMAADVEPRLAVVLAPKNGVARKISNSFWLFPLCNQRALLTPQTPTGSKP